MASGARSATTTTSPTRAACTTPLAALLFCQVPRVQHFVVNGRVVVRDGQLATLELAPLVERHNRLARVLVQG